MLKYRFLVSLVLSFTIAISCKEKGIEEGSSVNNEWVDSTLTYDSYTPKPMDRTLSRADYKHKLQGFWLGQCIANWTGLVTEMDKIGIPTKEGKGAGFYTRKDWGQPDQPNIWGSNDLSATIDFLYAAQDSIWGADDDTDIEIHLSKPLIQ